MNSENLREGAAEATAAQTAAKVPKAALKKRKREEKRAKKLQKNSKFNNIFAKTTILVVVSIVAAVALTSFVMVRHSKGLVVDSAYGKMLNLVTSYGSAIDKIEVEAKATKGLPREEYEKVLKDVKLEGVPSSFCYVINKSGVIAYHPDPSQEMKPNKVKILTEVIAGIAKGHTPESLCAEFKEDGITKYCSFYITTNKTIIVMSAHGEELMDDVNVLIRNAILLGLAILVVAVLLCCFVVIRFTKPLKQVTGVINDTASLKLKLPKEMDKLCKRGDEAGQIGRAVKKMSDSLTEAVGKIDSANENIEQNMERVEQSSNQIHVLCTDNSATTQELAASTEQISNMTTSISEHMDEMRAQSLEIKQQTEENSALSDEISSRADNLQQTTQDAIDRTKGVYEQVRVKTENAMEELKAVSKIDELTGAISEISDQTSLLSLNASIEAARAGEAGKGFSVVATEISNLAKRSKDTVGAIDEIITEVNAAVDNIRTTIEGTMRFLEENVLADYDGFNRIGDQYRQDAELFKKCMLEISGDMDGLNDSIQKVAGNVTEIQSTISNTSIGVSDVANKTADVVAATSDNMDLTNDTAERVEELKRIVQMFEV